MTERNKSYFRAYYLKNRDVYLIKAKERYRLNPEKVKKTSAEWKRKNPEKFKASQRKWKTKNPDKLLNYKLKSLFGITLKQYKKILEKQKNRCAICWVDGKEFTRRMHVDHNHKTGKVRGILCGPCNHGLGMFKDDINRLSNAIHYLKKNI